MGGEHKHKSKHKKSEHRSRSRERHHKSKKHRKSQSGSREMTHKSKKRHKRSRSKSRDGRTKTRVRDSRSRSRDRIGRHKNSRSRSRDRTGRHKNSRSRSRDRIGRHKTLRSRSRDRTGRHRNSRSRSRDRTGRHKNSRSRSIDHTSKSPYSDNDVVFKNLNNSRSEDRQYKSRKSRSERSQSCDSDGRSRKVEIAKVDENVDERERKDEKEIGEKKAAVEVKPVTIDHEFDWFAYRGLLSKIFFYDKDTVISGSNNIEDFYKFLEKFLAHLTKKIKEKKEKGCDDEPVQKALDPEKYPPITKDKVEYYYKVQSTLKGGKRKLSRNQIEQFHQIILYYLDFCEKQKKQKEDKIRRDQENLPIYQYRDDIVTAVKENQVVLVAGDTGCGKSTQVPQYLLGAGITKIACTQPRRIACVSLARRVSYETLNEYGSEVAYQVRFEKSRTKATRILFLTEGMLLRHMVSDPTLEQYEVLVIDEVHERLIHTDFLLGVVKCILYQRPDLKLVLMSATINIDLFSNYFDGAPVIKVPGRLFPIEMLYHPLSADEEGSKSQGIDPGPYIRILNAINHKYPDSERGDVLMFLSGMSEIMTVVEAARTYATKTGKWIILPLHSALGIAEQDKVFHIAPEGVRKCIVSTNIAETSVTIDGVRFVVDSGKVKEMSYDTKYKMQKLQEFWISRASSEQRKGRAGRTGPGVCYRLYSESDYNTLAEYSTPEIHRVPLDGLILQMMSMGLPDPKKFIFIEPPNEDAINTSVAFLKGQTALTRDNKLTPIGEMLSQLPVDIVIGKMLIMGSLFDMMDPVLSIAAALSVQSPISAKSQRQHDLILSRKALESDHGDPITLLNAFDEWVCVKGEGSDSTKWCRRRGLEEQRFYEMTKLKNQFHQLLMDNGLLEDKRELERERYKSIDERREAVVNKKRLHKLRYEQSITSKKRKILKLEDLDWEIEPANSDEEKVDESEALESNIKDLEFRLTHNLDKLHESCNKSRSFSLREMNLLKVILCSGLFPQISIADDHNTYKPAADIIYHTKNKGFVVLHPTSIFSAKPDLLEPPDDLTDPEKNISRLTGSVSNKHQLLAYVSLLETNKPFLTGLMRVPALQTLMLFATSIDTDSSCSRFVFDDWLEVCFEDGEEAETLLSGVIQLRSTWQHVIQLMIFAGKENAGLESKEMLHKARHLKKVLGRKLAEFLDSDIKYTVRRIMIAELKHMYMGKIEGSSSGVNDVLKGLFSSGGDPHPVKGGVMVNDYLTVNCLMPDDLSSEYSSCLQKHWTCQLCGESLVVTIAERLCHEEMCRMKQHNKQGSSEDKSSNENSSVPRKGYHCTVCSKNFKFTTAEIFKHRKECKPD